MLLLKAMVVLQEVDDSESGVSQGQTFAHSNARIYTGENTQVVERRRPRELGETKNSARSP